MTEKKEKKKIVIIAGPTAVGKTEYTIRLAQQFNGEIVSCDSMQLYKYMDIGSAKPTPEERARVPHHLVDVIDPREKFTVARYFQMARDAILDIDSRGKVPFVTGGTGLYINSLIYDMDFSAPPQRDEKIRDRYTAMAEEMGREYVYSKLMEMNPQVANRIHPNNLQKVIRALEAEELGSSLGDFSKDPEPSSLFDPVLMCITRQRQQLYNRINRRGDILFDRGLVQEVKGLMDMGLDESHISMKGIGYKEVIAYLKGQVSLEDAKEQVKKSSRHYAKRQLTWFRRYDKMKWFNISDYSDDESFLEDVSTWLKKQL